MCVCVCVCVCVYKKVISFLFDLQSDYLRKISLKMLTMETRSQNPMRDAMQSYYTVNGVNVSGPGIS